MDTPELPDETAALLVSAAAAVRLARIALQHNGLALQRHTFDQLDALAGDLRETGTAGADESVRARLLDGLSDVDAGGAN